MQFIKDRFNYLFNSMKGLILVAISMIGIETAIWDMLSGPMAEMGVREVVIKFLGMDIVQAEREGRISILYHSIAMEVVAIETCMVTSLLKWTCAFGFATTPPPPTSARVSVFAVHAEKKVDREIDRQVYLLT